MNIEIKAALLSGFVLPGLGQIYLKRYLRGLLMIMIILAGLSIIVGMSTVAILESLSTAQLQGGAIDMSTILNLDVAHSAQSSIYYKVILLLIVGCWIVSIIDAYRIGKRKRIDNPGNFIDP